MKANEQLDRVTVERMGMTLDGMDYVHPHMAGWSFGGTLGQGDSVYHGSALPERILLQVWDAGVRLGNQQKANEIKRALGV